MLSCQTVGSAGVRAGVQRRPSDGRWAASSRSNSWASGVASVHAAAPDSGLRPGARWRPETICPGAVGVRPARARGRREGIGRRGERGDEAELPAGFQPDLRVRGSGRASVFRASASERPRAPAPELCGCGRLLPRAAAHSARPRTCTGLRRLPAALWPPRATLRGLLAACITRQRCPPAPSGTRDLGRDATKGGDKAADPGS